MVKFAAMLYLKSRKKVKIKKSEWLKLPETQRDFDEVIDYSKSNRHGRNYRTVYKRIDIIDNPKIEQLRKLLKKQKVAFKESRLTDHIEFYTV